MSQASLNASEQLVFLKVQYTSISSPLTIQMHMNSTVIHYKKHIIRKPETYYKKIIATYIFISLHSVRA